MNELFILTLLNIPKVSRKTINKLIPIIEYTIKEKDISNLTSDYIINIFKEGSINNKRIPIPTKNMIEVAKCKAESIVQKSHEHGINSITILDEDFPDKLKYIPDPPVILFYKGNKKCLYKEKSIAIIGTRQPTYTGIEKAKQFGKYFAENDFVVVSGLAKGCDELAQRSCVDVGGESIAVLAGGLDTIYPASNKDLAKSILDCNGCLVSEYAVESKTFKNNFVERDRLQSALSKAVLVIETDVVGGTMHTVQYALEQKRILACYKHPKEKTISKKTHGNIKLIESKKAIGLYTKNDINEFKNKILESIHNVENNSELDTFYKGVQIKLL